MSGKKFFRQSFICAAVLATCSAGALAQDGKVRSNGLGLISADGETSINLTGRLHFDFRDYKSDFANGKNVNTGTAKYGDTFDMRRARIGFQGNLVKDLSYEVVFNATTSDSTTLDTGWINYTLSSPVQFRFGKFKQPFNLEELTSSNNIDFMERSYVNQVAPGKKLGMMVHGAPMTGFNYGVSVFQEGTAVSSSTANFQTAARVAFDIAKLADMKDSVLHVGVAGVNGKYDSTDGKILTVRSLGRGIEPFAGASSGTFASNTALEVSKSIQGLELAYANGPFKFQTETASTSFTGNNNGVTLDGKINTSYVEVLYNITGEKWSDAYGNGIFTGIKPLSAFKSGQGKGAWQVGLRTSSYDASDWKTALPSSSTNAIKGNTNTLGLTWFANQNMRVMLNHSITNFDNAFTPSGLNKADQETTTSVRLQVNF